MGKLYLGTQEITPFIYDYKEGVGILREVDANGKYAMPTSDFSFSLPSNATDLANDILYSAYNSCTHLVGVLDMSSLTAVTGNYCCQDAFRNTKITSVDLGSVVTVSGAECFNGAFRQCTRLVSVDLGSLVTVREVKDFYDAFTDCTSLTSIGLSSLATISGTSSFGNAFYGCTSLTTVDLSSLTTASGYRCLSYAFRGCTSLTSVDLSSLADISGQYALTSAFQDCTSLASLSFPALTTTSFGSYTNQFDNMLKNVVGCTVHFPAAIQSTIGSWASVTGGFGGTNTTVLFDL